MTIAEGGRIRRLRRIRTRVLDVEGQWVKIPTLDGRFHVPDPDWEVDPNVRWLHVESILTVDPE